MTTNAELDQIFERVYNAVNERRSKQGGGVLANGSEQLNEILASEGIDKKTWYHALSKAKLSAPNLRELFYKAIGKKVPAARAPRAPAEQEESEPTEAAVADVLTTVLHWLDKISADDRRRVLAAVAAFFPEE